MATWASKRKTRYALGFIIFLIIFIGVPTFLILYEKPTCFDGKLNGDELEVDCGGSCTRLCQSDFLPPRIEWGGAKMEKVADSLYNVAAYIINPNVNGGAIDVPYQVSLFDGSGALIVSRRGEISLNAHRNSLAFQGLMDVKDKIPARATFEFTAPPQWFKSEDGLTDIAILEKTYEENGDSSKLEVMLENRGLARVEDIRVGVILYDSSGNVLGFSQTFIDSIRDRGGREIAIFTWPINRNGKVIREEVILGIKPVLIK